MLSLAAAGQPHLFARQILASLDTASQFYPWYAYLGQGLRQGRVLGWNPHTFSGTPFAANPLSGWTYLPAMVFFTALPLPSAAHVYLVVHPLLASGATYLFGRVLGLDRAGSALAGVAYAGTGFFEIQNACCFAFASVYAWLPVALLGAEQALRSVRRERRGFWWGIAGLGLSQILAAWLGQGAYYAVLLVALYVAARTLLPAPPGLGQGAWVRVWHLVEHAGAVVLFGTALAAAGLLPRLEFNALSNLAGGYTGGEASVGGLAPRDWILPARPGFWYAGVTVLALAAMAPVLARGPLRVPVRFFAGFTLTALCLTGTVATPLQAAVFLVLPGFARLHLHAPERILTVAYLGPALLAGVTITSVGQRGRLARALVALALLLPAVVLFDRMPLAAAAVLVAGAVAGVLLLWPGWRRGRLLAPCLVVLVVWGDLASGGAVARADYALTDPLSGTEKLAAIDLETYDEPNGVAVFLRQRLADGPFRYLGYAPELRGHPLPYTTRFLDPTTAALDVNNRALPLGLQDVQGYDASHLGRYDAYLRVLNGRAQNYHDAEVFREGLGSPLLGLLNARYIIVPAGETVDTFDSAALQRLGPIAYEDERVKVFENTQALSRVWLVHAAEQVPADRALELLAAGQVDPRQVALLEDPPPPLVLPEDSTLDQAVVTAYEPDRIRVTTRTPADGLLVLSEISYPAWQGYVDDRPARIYVADGALRAVPIGPGEHVVELRYESQALSAGIVVSVAAAALLTLLAILMARAEGSSGS